MSGTLPPPENGPMTMEAAMASGMEITDMVGGQFYRDNQSMYLRAGIEREDLIGHLRYYILVARYLPTVEKRPDYYVTVSSYRKSLYTACKRACFAHHRKHIRSQKRGIGLRPGFLVSLDGYDDTDENSEEAARPLQVADDGVSCSARLRPTGNCLIDRCLAYFQYGGTWDTLKVILPIPPQHHDDLEHAIRTHLTDYAN